MTEDGETRSSDRPSPETSEVRERESASPNDAPSPVKGDDTTQSTNNDPEKETLNDGSLSSSEMQEAGMGEDEKPSEVVR